jgi:hypothetical protein
MMVVVVAPIVWHEAQVGPVLLMSEQPAGDVTTHTPAEQNSSPAQVSSYSHPQTPVFALLVAS